MELLPDPLRRGQTFYQPATTPRDVPLQRRRHTDGINDKKFPFTTTKTRGLDPLHHQDVGRLLETPLQWDKGLRGLNICLSPRRAVPAQLEDRAKRGKATTYVAARATLVCCEV